MTMARYSAQDCSPGSQVRGEAWDASCAWIVNFNNGNANNNHRNNNACVRAVRSVPAGEYQETGGETVILRALYDAWRAARRGKNPSCNQLEFEVHWTDGLLRLQRALQRGTWRPGPSACFVADHLKAREIHAPDFADRVVHHWLVPPLEAIWEPRFIADSFANRKGKGSHAAVRRVQQFVRQVASGQGGGYFLQLDIHNFFNSIHRETLWAILKPVLQQRGVSLVLQRAVHALLRHPPLHAGVRYRGKPEDFARVPLHKRLANAPAGCGLPIGNLSSQLFANIYLDRLDQFVKHELKARRYVRYVDDFILIHRDREVLAAWQARIVEFLASELRLRLKDDIRLRPLGDGIDFLGYVIKPTHTLVRRRVVSHLRTALSDWERAHVVRGFIRAIPSDLRGIRSIAVSYSGHLRHANSQRLRRGLEQRFPWLPIATRPRRFHHDAEGQRITLRIRNAGSN
ncbi:MAG TPA: reverse transcriptase/maturase family protein [Rhodanobacteraceae bacterium]|nr:reverse transcriptase/maturase family protein [Rhodanobacteraceae bacterium]